MLLKSRYKMKSGSYIFFLPNLGHELSRNGPSDDRPAPYPYLQVCRICYWYFNHCNFDRRLRKKSSYLSGKFYSNYSCFCTQDFAKATISKILCVFGLMKIGTICNDDDEHRFCRVKHFNDFT